MEETICFKMMENYFVQKHTFKPFDLLYVFMSYAKNFQIEIKKGRVTFYPSR